MIPIEFHDEASKIVDSHYPADPKLMGFNPQLQLSDKDHETLNSGNFTLRLTDGERATIFRELRVKYADDPKALAEIDAFDPSSAKFQKLNALIARFNLTSGVE